MSRRAQSGRSRWMSLVLLGGTLAAWPAVALGQEGAPLPPTTPVREIPPSPCASQELLERLGKMEERLDWLTKQNEGLLRQNQMLAEKVGVPFRNISDPGPQGVITSAPSGTALTGVTAPGDVGTGLFSSAGPGATSGTRGMGGERDSASGGSGRGAVPAGGGRSLSRAGGGDPTAVGQAQEVGNLHLGKVPLNAYYDFDNAGFHLATKDEEFSIGVTGMTQLDGMLYSRPTPGIDTSSGFYNPRSRIYFEGHFTKPISWEFSFQNFYDTVQLLDAYVNFNYDPRFQVQIGRYKNPFGYEFYREHIWDLMAPERSLWAVNYEANRRFGLMAHGVLLDERVEYALGSFDTQRNEFSPSFSHQDFEAYLNFKPFYTREEGFLLRNLQFGGSCDVGTENQTPVPAVLRTTISPGASAINSPSAANAAELPFLAFGPNVLERGSRAMWEAHLAYYYAGLSLVSTVESGHEGYSNGLAAGPVHVPVNGWHVQAAYLLTGETIRDRTNIQPLHPFDLRKGHFGWGAWEVSSRFSYLQLGHQVFSAGLADPNLWSNRAEKVDVGLNWYLNQFVKVYFDWEHAMFGSPVLSTNGNFRRTNDLFWIRTQVFF
jgi:phosphate-selective porin OprO and OprP